MNIILGITGSIAAYQSYELARLLIKQGCTVKTVITNNAKQLISEETLYALTTHKPCGPACFSENDPLLHITLARWADKIVIYPASANLITKLALGFADDLLTTLCLATQAPLVVAPAMNKVMWEKPQIQAHCETLIHRGIQLMPPRSGLQVCGDVGLGCVIEPEEMLNHLVENHHLLSGKTVLVTAGPTYEPIDPIRYIANHSSGKMGYAMARACQALGANVILISGPVALQPPCVSKIIKITTADHLFQAVMDNIVDADIFISAAAVADFRVAHPQPKKIKKVETMNLKLIKNKDILKAVSQLHSKLFIIGFCAETENLLSNAKKKLKEKNLDVIIANHIHPNGYPFSSDTNTVVYIDKHGNEIHYEKENKHTLAKKIMKKVCEIR